MDVTGIAQLATNLAESGTRQEIDMAVLKKARDIQASTATQLLDAIAPPQSANLPAHLGQNINTTA